MYSLPPLTALLLFTRTPDEEARHKRLAPGSSFRKNRRLAHTLIAHARRISNQTGLPVFVIDSDVQRGSTFGERLTHAFADIYKKGFDRVIAIGNDTLSLTSSDLLSAAFLLQNYDAVVGPTQSGGSYLIGLHRSAFLESLFCDLPWETDRLYDDLINYLDRNSTSVWHLATRSDANTSDELLEAVNGLSKASSLYRTLRSLLHSPSCSPSFLYITLPQPIHYRTLSLRAPPIT